MLPGLQDPSENWGVLDKLYPADLTDASWALLAPLLPPARLGGRPRTTKLRAVIDAVFYLLRTGCQWRPLPREFPAWGTVYYYFRAWKSAGIWTSLQREIYEHLRSKAGRSICPSVVIIEGNRSRQQNAAVFVVSMYTSV